MFRPLDNTPVDYKVKSVQTVKTTLFDEVRVTYEESGSYIARTFPDKPDEVEVEWQVGPIPGLFPFPSSQRKKSHRSLFFTVDDDQGKEVIMRYNRDNFPTEGKFWTDSNGRQDMERVRGKRASFTLDNAEDEPVAANYFPITSCEPHF